VNQDFHATEDELSNATSPCAASAKFWALLLRGWIKKKKLPITKGFYEAIRKIPHNPNFTLDIAHS